MLDKHLIAKTEPAALQENMVVREGVRSYGSWRQAVSH